MISCGDCHLGVLNWENSIEFGEEIADLWQNNFSNNPGAEKPDRVIPSAKKKKEKKVSLPLPNICDYIAILEPKRKMVKEWTDGN